MRGKRRKMREMRSRLIFGACTVISGAAAMFGMNVLPVMAEENAGEEMVVSDAAADVGAGVDAAGELSENALNTGGDENLGVYDFKDSKTTGTVTVTKVWDDDKTNEERAIPDIKISTEKPSKSTLGYTVTFHGNGLKFADGTDENMIVYNSAGEIVQGEYKMAVGNCVGWCTGKNKGDRVVFLDDGTPQIEMTGDLDLWAKEMTFEIKGYSNRLRNEFNRLIPNTVTEIFFTDEIKPETASVIDVDADGDGGVVAWTEYNGTIMKISTQIKGMKVQAAKNSRSVFNSKSKLVNISFTNLDTQKVTDMSNMFYGCRGLTTLDLSSFDTQNVTNMNYMFSGCSGMTALDLSPIDTRNVTDMYSMFYGCSGLTALNLSTLDTQNVKYMGFMFSGCSGLTTITTGPNFKFIGTNYGLSGTWQNTAGETFTEGNFPSNVADTYIKIK